MPWLPPELRLLHLLALNAAVVAAAWRLARRASPGRSADALAIAAVDAGLLVYLTQYLAVALPGVAGLLGPGSMTLAGLALAAAMWAGADRLNVAPPPDDDADDRAGRWEWIGCAALLAGLLAALIYRQADLPPLANDPLTYHLPAAVGWLQSGSITEHETWFFNPANAYSPLAGSTFIAWLHAPPSNDLAARFVQAPAALLLFAAVGLVARGLGATVTTSALLGLAAAGCRATLGQATLAKDDLFVAAFFAAAVASLSPTRLRDPAAPWRVGAALGLMLATKFTALLALPALLLAIDAPVRAGWGWRRYATVAAVVALLAGPWYLRNLLAHGNPVFPVAVAGLPGLLTTARAESLGTAGGVWRATVTHYAGTTVPYAVALTIGWLVGVAAAWRSGRGGRGWLADPLARLCLVGPPLSLLVFVLTSPYPEVRFVYPALALLAASAALAGRLGPRVGLAVAAALAAVAVATSFERSQLLATLPAGVAVGVAVVAVAAGWRHAGSVPRLREGALLAAGLVAAGWIYVFYPAWLNAYRATANAAWSQPPGTGGYGDLGRAWAFVRDDLPPGPVAYARTFFTYPLLGFDGDRRAAYAPTRRGVRSLAELPPVGERLPGERIAPAAVAATLADPDRATWAANLRATGAAYLFVAAPPAGEPPAPEAAWARASGWRVLFENGSAVVFAVPE